LSPSQKKKKKKKTAVKVICEVVKMSRQGNSLVMGSKIDPHHCQKTWAD